MYFLKTKGLWFVLRNYFVFVIIPDALMKCPNQCDLREKGIVWLTDQGYSPSWQGSHSNQSLRQLVVCVFVSTVKKLRAVDATAQSTLIFYNSSNGAT